MQHNIKLSASTRCLNDRHLIVITGNGKKQPSLSEWLVKQLNDGHQQLTENIISGSSPNDLGSIWNYPSTGKSAGISLIASGTKQLTKVALDKLKLSLTRCVRQAAASASKGKTSPVKLQIYCEDISFDTNDLSLRGANLKRHSVEEVILTTAASLYKYDEFKSAGKSTKSIDLALIHPKAKDWTNRLKQLQGLIHGINLAKDLANAPPNLCTPPYLAAQGKQLAKQYKKMSCKVLGEKEMKKLGMGAYLAVTDGSAYPPQLTIMEYAGGKKGQKPLVIVGKGMTFDTGGISIKPSGKMDEMKYDMCGAASVIGTMKAIAEMGLPVNLIGMAVGAENSVDSKSYRPGDIVTTMSGKSVEVLNTDAEGRLVLCDTLTYVAKYKPRYVIDIATLTGACVVALGHLRSGMFANDEELASRIESAGATSHDLVWQLPLDKAYMEDMNTNFADIANVGGRSAGTITAAGFLAEFAEEYPWAHLDIAGTAWYEGANKGATGRPVPLLTQFIIDSL